MYKENEQLNWHFDLGEFAVILLLQWPEDGGPFPAHSFHPVKISEVFVTGGGGR